MNSNIILYGIANCDTVKKARVWLNANTIDYHFHDFRVDGLSEDQIHDFLAHCTWENLVNKRSTTWKTLSDEQKNSLANEQGIKLLLEYPTLIKRPVLLKEQQLVIGFKAEEYAALFAL